MMEAVVSGYDADAQRAHVVRLFMKLRYCLLDPHMIYIDTLNDERYIILHNAPESESDLANIESDALGLLVDALGLVEDDVVFVL
ncbi:hypothetical protein Tco_1085448 [Tanacetum coccineum]